jgi:hypothetical protein
MSTVLTGRSLLAALTFAVLPLCAAAAPECAHDTFTIGGTPVAVNACAAPARKGAVPVALALTGPKGSVQSNASIELIDGGVSRAIDDVDLAGMGLGYTLHLTLAYRGGAVTIEHALLLPGAVPLK